MEPWVAIAAVCLMCGILFAGLIFVGFVSDLKLPDPKRFLKISQWLFVVFTVLSILNRYMLLTNRNDVRQFGNGFRVRLPHDNADWVTREVPDYPSSARQQHISGRVLADVLISADGKVEHVTILTGPPLLASAATSALLRWVYRSTFSSPERITLVAIDFESTP